MFFFSYYFFSISGLIIENLRFYLTNPQRFFLYNILISQNSWRYLTPLGFLIIDTFRARFLYVAFFYLDLVFHGLSLPHFLPLLPLMFLVHGLARFYQEFRSPGNATCVFLQHVVYDSPATRDTELSARVFFMFLPEDSPLALALKPYVEKKYPHQYETHD